MKAILQRYATPFITGLFLVSLISGIALFFHVGNGVFNEMHEWLSVALILPFALHVWRNWRPMTHYLGRLPMTLALLISTGAAVAMAWPSNEGRSGGPPQIAFSRQIIANTAGEIAPLLGLTSESLVETLKARGFATAAPDMALIEIATKSGKNESQLVRALLPAQP
ncbi:DUF4405 domain-containing protein [Sinorhizobium mexicanum]|uniref:DUF4405 domain-containing protein n=1 Tax=Sinorhizobium mexicanum TaxID=375549 RepID=A0A859QSV5_9HYPH|nr:DUF4405 domain-containing protein [Sinorhizobium mexicanum]MBP1886173.1 hypothetical protein [Sinorhizobium mexicanum]QLL65217.1 DUF4405 domain-containing protein [Sinorhizobium mexicanum]